MEHHDNNQQGNESRSEYKSFAFKRFVIAAILIVLVVWALSVGPGMLHPSKAPGTRTIALQEHTAPEPEKQSGPAPSHPPMAARATDDASPSASTDHTSAHDTAKQLASEPPEEVKALLQKQPSAEMIKVNGKQQPSSNHTAPKAVDSATPHPSNEQTADTASEHVYPQTAPHENNDKAAKTASEQTHAQAAPQDQPHGPPPEAVHVELPTGVAFVEAVIQPLHHELNEHFWGWRSNDIVNFTDNVNNFQRGVLEVTRRSVVLLSERISRTGTTDSFNPHLENAMNWLMVKADRYWFPAPESKYNESIKELEKYKAGLTNGQASFYTRSDNIIPLLASYENLLGSCDENLVKQKQEDGSTVGYFEADDYFFYAQGVASTMANILEAIHHDFASTIKSRHGEELLHHAIVSCRQAAALNPLLITNGDLDGIFANHRAHLAAPISHARFYIGQLIKTLST